MGCEAGVSICNHDAGAALLTVISSLWPETSPDGAAAGTEESLHVEDLPDFGRVTISELRFDWC